ncbi:hypothetical protein PIB30_042592 [Stylosanthes scabra]|uniref:Uncharacterized protein n=1 Tax=Stylosanthes scabra TaxID=79078 RepID=A0ABU6UF19_9FABA|nr:hypothetical protein [Stylosanthes scabra]
MSHGQSLVSETSVGGSASAFSSHYTFDDSMDHNDSLDSVDSSDDLVSEYDSASETDAKVTRSSPSFKICRGSEESNQKGGTGHLDSFGVVVGLREDNRRMGSGIIYYEIEKREKYEDSDEEEDLDLAIVKTRRYHFDDEPFIHPLHSVWFDPDRPYELPIESLLALRRRDPSKGKYPSLQRSGPSRRASPTPQYSPLHPVSRLGSPPSLSKMMCKGDEVEDKEASEEVPERVDDAKGIEEEEEEEEEEEDPEEDAPEEEMPVIPRTMDVDPDEDYLQYLEELRRHPKYSPVHNS